MDAGENVAAELASAGALRPEQIAVHLGDAVLTNHLLDEAGARVAGLLAANGIGADARVALVLPPGPVFAAAYYGILRVGAVVVRLAETMTSAEIAHCLSETRAAVVLAWRGSAAPAQSGARAAGVACITVGADALTELLGGFGPVAGVAARRGADLAEIRLRAGHAPVELTHNDLRRHPDPDLELLSPADEPIVRGGLVVDPREVEEVLLEHPHVHEAAVVGVPHPDLGQEIGAAVVLRDGTETTPDELRQFLRAQVAAYKCPQAIWLVDALHRDRTGTVVKRAIEIPVGVRS